MKRSVFILLVLPGLLFLSFTVLVPLLLTLVSTLSPQGSFSFESYIKFFSDRYFTDILGTTLFVSLLTTAFCIVLGFPVAYYISGLSPGKKSLLLALAIFPLLTSSVVRSFSWMIILGKNGLLNSALLNLGLLKEPLSLLYTPEAMIIGLVHLFLPLLIISLVGVMENIDPDLLKAAEGLGAGRFTAVRKILLPLSLPGLIVGSILVFVGSFTAYTTPALLGGKKRVLSTLLYQNALTLNDWHSASVIATIMVVVSFAVLALLNLLAAKLAKKE